MRLVVVENLRMRLVVAWEWGQRWFCSTPGYAIPGFRQMGLQHNHLL